MPQFKVVKKAFGPASPGAKHRTLNVGEIITADELSSKQSWAVPIQEEAGAAQAAPVTPATLTAAQRRAAAAAAAKAAEKVEEAGAAQADATE